MEITWTDSHDARSGAAAIACRFGTKFPRGIRAVEIVLEDTVFDNERRLCRHTFIVEWTGPKSGGHARIIDDCNVGRRDRLTDLIDQEGTAAIDRTARYGI